MVVQSLLAACAAFTLAAPVAAGVIEPNLELPTPATSNPIIYQGHLSYLDIPVTTSVDLRFRAFDAASGGAQLGREIVLEDVTLDDGAFQAVLDFGASNPSVWIEIDVRSPSGDGEYTTLSPRQHMNAQVTDARAGAESAQSATNSAREPGDRERDQATRPGSDQQPRLHVDVAGGGTSGVGSPTDGASPQGGSRGGGWTANGNNVFFNTGNVGIGLVAPAAPLHIRDQGARVLWAINNETGPGGGFGIQAEAAGTTSRALFARANSTTGFNYGVFGQSMSSRGTGVFGQTSSTFGTGTGVSGVSRAASGTGVRGLCTNASGTNFAIKGEVMSSDAWAGHFMGGMGAFIEGGISMGEEDVFADFSLSSDGSQDLFEMQVSDTTVARFAASGALSVGTDLLPPPMGILSESDVYINDGDLRFFDETAPSLIIANGDMTFSKDFNDDENGSLFSWESNNGSNMQMFLDDGPGNDGDNAELSVNGDVTANGFDYAEMFTTGQDGLEPGDVVVMARGETDLILRATDAYQNLLVGVVSTNPGFIAGNPIPDSVEIWRHQAIQANGGNSSDIQNEFRRRIRAERDKARPIALAGRVPVKVDAAFGAIKAGDHLTSSKTAGHAMVQTQAGPTLGIALEDFNAGTGVITVLVQPGWFGGEQTPRVIDDRDARILELEARLMALEELLLGDAP